MIKKQFFLIILALFVVATACNTSKKTKDAVTKVMPTEDIPEVKLDDINVTASAPDSSIPDDQEIAAYQASAERKNDLIHTKLDLRFDWAKQRVLGKATLTFKPYFYPTNELVLDAKNFDFNNISIEGQKTPLKYTYNNEQVTIQLDKTYNRTEEYKVFIDYVAKPEERTNIGGSAAINSDKGLYFINPKGEDPDFEKPRQIWSQGETESNSCWFPTIDKPNERATDEIYLTVEDKFKTLSNGLMLSSTKNSDGTRTDYWKMDQPHAPYLVMIAVGEYAVVKEKWEDIEVAYMVEPAFEKDAKAIFPHTTELLSFFSNKLGVKYPWKKYTQIITRDYVSGAMENTTAGIFGEYMQAHERDLIDVPTNESVVAHEMFHHWFGDYVTTESWSNLTLNEGFANYSEYLWFEHKYGREVADAHWLSELQGYLGQAKNQRHALIDFTYGSREDMFDAHSYNKGGIVLHMLRNYIGDDAFFTALGDYLRSNAYTSVEGHTLRMAFEKTSGKDLNWFFNQWYYTPGHPEVTISKNYDAVTGKLSVTIAQTQNATKNLAVYKLPLAIDVYTAAGEKQRFDVTTTKRKETFIFEVAKKPLLVNVDANRTTLWEATYVKTPEELAFQYANAPLYADRQEAMEGLSNEYVESAEAKAAHEAVLKDKNENLRAMGVSLVNIEKPENAAQLEKMAISDIHSSVRSAAIFRLAQTKDKKYAATAQQILDKEQAYPVISEALQALYVLNKEVALTYIKKFESEDNMSIASALALIYSENPKAEYLPFFEKRMSKVNGYDAVSIIGSYANMIVNLDDAAQSKGIERLQALALNQTESPWRRYGAGKGLNDMKMAYKGFNNTEKVKQLEKIMTEVIAKESNKQIKAAYGMF
jgi:aminopeptidase N